MKMSPIYNGLVSAIIDDILFEYHDNANIILDEYVKYFKIFHGRVESNGTCKSTLNLTFNDGSKCSYEICC
jgi:hypothetical protein